MKIPFTTEQFFEVIKNYNLAVFPAQLIFFVFGIVVIFLIYSKKNFSNIIIGGFWAFYGFGWGWFTTWPFFATINKAAYAFGGLFILQGIFLFTELFRNKLSFSFNRNIQNINFFN